MAKGSTKAPRGDGQASFASINTRAFVTVVAVLCAVLALCGALSYFIPQGTYLRGEDGVILPDSYVRGEVKGIALWRVLTAPVRVFVSSDALTVIMISLFLLIMSGIFNLLDKTGGVRMVIERLLRRLHGRHFPVLCITVLVFMLFGSFFGMFEELVTLLPIVIVFMLSMGLDTMMGLGTCLLAACFGFSAAMTNPFSVGLASQVGGVAASEGMWLRLVFFVMTYLLLILFLYRYLKKLRRDPASSPSYAVDRARRRAAIETDAHREDDPRTVRIFGVFFGVQGLLLLLIASVRAISGYAIPILAAGFLIGGIVAGLMVCPSPRSVFRYILQGAVAMLPAVLMIALAASAKLVMEESGILDTVMHEVITLLSGKSPFVAVLLIYALIFVLQFFIGSASAKIMLVMPIVMPVAQALGVSPSLVILAYCMADGFTDVILPTNPILLISLSMANVSYGTWVKWTWKLQLALLTLSVLTLGFGVLIGY